jgi:putative ABC transport system ATP-binding protein
MRGVEKRYQDVAALRGSDLEVHRGESVAVMGPSGSGKSTLALCMTGVLVPDRGEVWFDGERIDGLSESRRSTIRLSKIGLVFQKGHLLTDLTAVENVALTLMLGGMAKPAAVSAAATWFAPLGLQGLEKRRPGEMSSGQAHRVAIARALVNRPPLVVADEPTAALDQATGQSVMEVLVGLTRQLGAALVVVTHDPAVATRCDRRIDIRDGAVVRVQEVRP